MGTSSRLLAVALVAVLGGSSFAGCITVFPVKGLLSTDPSASSQSFLNFPAYDREEQPTGSLGCSAGTDVRPFYVPQRSQRVTISVYASLKAIPNVPETLTGSLDFTVKDGAGTVWVDIHEVGRSVDKTVTVEGPRPGAWGLELNWNLCEVPVPPANVHDSFEVHIVVRQPA